MTKIKTAIALILTVATVFSFGGCLRYSSNILEVTQNSNKNNFELDYVQNDPGTTASGNSNENEQSTSAQTPVTDIQPIENTTAAQIENTTAAEEESSTAQTISPSAWTTAEILAYVTNAVTKTKAYTSAVTVDHSEAFEVNITKAPGGSMIQSIANGIIESVVKPTDEVLTFNNGTAVNSEGETVPLLLPKRGAFTLTVDGVASATAKQSGDLVVVSIKLVEEVGTLTEHPVHNAASVGYLDASDVDLGPVTLNYLDITYTGSTIDMTINSDGYVEQVIYKIPISIDCEGKALGLTAQIQCVGQQSENWKINW